MKLKSILIGLGLIVIGLPVVLVLAVVIGYKVLDRTSGTLVVAGETRQYLLHVPASYDAARPTPLVISMHGTGLWPAGQSATSGWNAVADENGFIVVYPSGIPDPDEWMRWPKKWHTDPKIGNGTDVQFISDLIDALEMRYNIDPTRIYANGYSAGAAMANLLACRLPDRLAAIGTVATAHLPWDWCGDLKLMPLIAFHGTADKLIPYEGGTSGAIDNLPLESVPAWIAGWAQRNGCSASPVESAVAADVMRLEHAGCESGAGVVLYTIEGGGHTWPGTDYPAPEALVGPTSNSIDATRETWTFFRNHQLAVVESP